jgi:hypothetical protein
MLRRLIRQHAIGATGRSEFAVPPNTLAVLVTAVSEFQPSQRRDRRARAELLVEQFSIVAVPVKMTWGFEQGE